MKNLPAPRDLVAKSCASTVLVGAIAALERREDELKISLMNHRRCAALSHHLRIVGQRLFILRKWLSHRRPAYWRAYVQDALDLIGSHRL
jgi:hypothetical protein